MQPRVWIHELEFNNGSKIELAKSDIIVFVGPNNSGKSATLKESAGKLRQRATPGKVLKNITAAREGSQEDIINYIDSHSHKIFGSNPEPTLHGMGYSIYKPQIEHYWQSIQNGLNDLFPVFVKILNTEERLSIANPPQNINLTQEPPQHPIHVLQRYDDLENKFNEYFKLAFDTDLTIHRNAGSTVPLYVGERPTPKEGEDRVSHNYLLDLEKLDLLHQQGDGMRSFVGVLLSAFFTQHSILFIDEPDAFLHPPQARLLGKMLTKELSSERQIFLTTHSEDFLKGLLESGNNNLKIIRITKTKKTNNISMLNHEDITKIWSDSLLRHSNILNGLFHSQVIICESDSDCRFYSSILSALYDNSGSLSPDTLFVHCGGKHRIPVAVRALKKLNVNVKVIADFDLLNDINPIKLIYEELGGDWPIIQPDWKLVKESIDSKRPELETSELKAQIDTIFTATLERVIPKAQITNIQKSLKKASPWAHAKEIGKTFIPNGEATKAYTKLANLLQQKGLFIVEVGELESFAKSIGDHGPRWVSEVMIKDLKSDPELETARAFIKQVIEQQ